MDALEWLWEEYKLVQGKIEQAGERRFKIREWAITVVAVGSAGALAARAGWATYVPFFLATALFQSLEALQAAWISALTERAARIEKYLSEKANDETGGLGLQFPSPGVVRTLGEARRSVPGLAQYLLRWRGAPFYWALHCVVVISALTSLLG